MWGIGSTLTPLGSLTVKQSGISHMRTTILLGLGSGLITLAMTSPAMAQTDDVAAEFDGLYVGGGVGYSIRGNGDDTVVFDTDRDGAFDDTVRTGPGADAFSTDFCNGAALGATRAAGCDKERGGIDYFARLGFDKQFGNLVIGLVGEVGKSELSDSITAYSTTPANYVFTREIDWSAALRARAGLAADRTLFYATGGVARAELERDFSTTNAANSFTLVEDGSDVWGWQAGGGVEQKIGESFSIQLEYLYNRYNDDGNSVAVGPGTAPATNPFLLVDPTGTDMARSSDRFDFHSVRAVAAFRF